VAVRRETLRLIETEFTMTDQTKIERSATITINKSPEAVFEAVSDITKIGDRSPECLSCGWVDGASEAAVGAKFTGDNEAKLGPISLKKWTTTSEVTASEPGRLFEFSTEDYTTWRYEMTASGEGSTKVTESVSFPPGEGFQGFLYQKVLNRPKSLEKGMKATLAALKAELEA